MTTPVRWGIAGPGSIANRFAEGVRLTDEGHILAVASRSNERAKEFADRFGVPRWYGSYSDLARDPDVDAIYVATPHAHHASAAIAFLNAGKHVLCEKPFALNATEAAAMIAAARENRRFLMEAMWSRFLPAYQMLAGLLKDGTIGQPLVVEADFGFRMPVMPTHRLFDVSLGGGALLDLGIYPLQLCSLVFGPPDGTAAVAHLGETGVDEQIAVVLHHSGGGLGVVKAAIRVGLSCTARIFGTDGAIELPAFMHCPQHLVVRGDIVDAGFEGEGLRFQLDEVHRCLAAGAVESATMPLEETLRLATTMDRIRRSVGLAYPGED